MTLPVPLKFGTRPIQSSLTEPSPEQVHPSAMKFTTRASLATCNWLARSISPGISLHGLFLKASMRTCLAFAPLFGRSLASYCASHSSPDTVDKATREALQGTWCRQEKLKILLGSGVPMTLARARTLFNGAVKGGDVCERDLWAAIRFFYQEGHQDEVEEKLKTLLVNGLSDYLVGRLQRLDQARLEEGGVNPEEFNDLFTHKDAQHHHRNALQMVVDQARDIVLVDLLIENGARLGVPDSDQKTEIDIAIDNEDYCLAAKLRMALNYQTLCEQAKDRSSHVQCAVAGFEFDESTMTFEEAEKKFYEKLTRHVIPFTHGALICHRKDGRVTTRPVHLSCPVSNDMQVTALHDDLDLPLFREKVAGMYEIKHKLTRRPLHERPFEGVDQINDESQILADEHWESAYGRLTWGVVKGSFMAGASYFVDGYPTATALAGMCTGITEACHSEDETTNTAESLGQCLGGATGGLVAGCPLAGAQVGGCVVRLMKVAGKFNLPTSTIDAVGEEYKNNKDVLDNLIWVGGCLCTVSSAGALIKLTNESLYWIYVAAGGLLPVELFRQQWSNPRFRYGVYFLLGASVFGTAGLAVFGGVPAVLGAGALLQKTAVVFSPSLRGAQALSLCSGVLYKCNWDVQKVLSIFPSSGRLAQRGISWAYQRFVDRNAGLDASSRASLFREEAMFEQNLTPEAREVMRRFFASQSAHSLQGEQDIDSQSVSGTSSVSQQVDPSVNSQAAENGEQENMADTERPPREDETPSDDEDCPPLSKRPRYSTSVATSTIDAGRVRDSSSEDESEEYAELLQPFSKRELS